MREGLKQLQLMVVSLTAVVLLAVLGLQASVTPSYALITRPTPTPTPAPYTFGDPRLTTRTMSFNEAQALITSFKLLRPRALPPNAAQQVIVSQDAGRVVSVRQTFSVVSRSTAEGNTEAGTALWITQAPGANPYNVASWRSNLEVRPLTLTLPDGRQQIAELRRNRFGATVSWNDDNGFISVRGAGESFPVERLIAIASSLQ